MHVGVRVVVDAPDHHVAHECRRPGRIDWSALIHGPIQVIGARLVTSDDLVVLEARAVRLERAVQHRTRHVLLRVLTHGDAHLPVHLRADPWTCREDRRLGRSLRVEEPRGLARQLLSERAVVRDDHIDVVRIDMGLVVQNGGGPAGHRAAVWPRHRFRRGRRVRSGDQQDQARRSQPTQKSHRVHPPWLRQT